MDDWGCGRFFQQTTVQGQGENCIDVAPSLLDHRGLTTLIQRSASSWPRRCSDSAWMLVPGVQQGEARGFLGSFAQLVYNYSLATVGSGDYNYRQQL